MTVSETMPATGIGGAIVLDAKESVMIETETMSEVRSEEETRGIEIGRERKKGETDETGTDCNTISIACNAANCHTLYGIPLMHMYCTSTGLSKPFLPGRQGTLLRSNQPYSWQSGGLSASTLVFFRCYGELAYLDGKELHTSEKYRVILGVKFI